MVSYTNNNKLLEDDGHDLLHLTLLENDTLSARKMIDGFIHPMDVMVLGDKLYLLEMGNRNGKMIGNCKACHVLGGNAKDTCGGTN